MKPTYILFYKTPMCLTNLLNEVSQFRLPPMLETPDKTEWEHYTLLKIKCEDFDTLIKGHGLRVWGIFIERCLYEEMRSQRPNIKYDIFEPMLIGFGQLSNGITLI